MTTFKSVTLSRALCCALVLLTGLFTVKASDQKDFLRVNGENIVNSKGEKFFIKGTNLGNWVNPEGYMFGFSRTNSYTMIDNLISQLFGPEEAAEIWRQFRTNYITEPDIAFIASQGANTIRFPFHYKLFTNDAFMGTANAEEGFAMLDRLVEWARKNNIRLVLDMHDCPGGQTGDNIDDSFGYPFLMTDARSQELYISIWEKIANRYKDEDVILGYELMNEPIATFWEGEEKAMLNGALEPLYKRTVKAIRAIDNNHIILLGGSQWNSNFEPFTDWKFDNNIMYTCHRYGGDATADAIRSFIDFRNKTGLPMYMGEIGHNSMEWQDSFARVMEENNIGYTYWPYKKINDSSMTGVKQPEGWEQIVTFSEAPRGTFAEIREARAKVNIDSARKAFYQYIENAKYDNMLRHADYIRSMRLK